MKLTGHLARMDTGKLAKRVEVKNINDAGKGKTTAEVGGPHEEGSEEMEEKEM